MNIGIFVTSLTPKGVSQARFQASVFAGLKRMACNKYRFFVLSYEVPSYFTNEDNWRYVTIQHERRGAQFVHSVIRILVQVMLLVCRLCGMGGGRFAQMLRQWMTWQPRYFRQIRSLNLRLLYNMNTHELPTIIPYIRTIW